MSAGQNGHGRQRRSPRKAGERGASSSTAGSEGQTSGAGPAAAAASIADGLAALTRSGAQGAGLDAKVLVLNKLYLAVRVVPARRAFSLLFRDLAEVIHVGDGQYLSYDFDSWADLSLARATFPQPDAHDWVRTVRFEIAVPKVVRLLGYDRLPAQHVKLNRRNLFARDRNRCQYCGHTFPTSELSIDHVLPRSQGGADTWENLVCSCVRCNARKGGRTPEQAGLALVSKPVRPKRNPVIALRLGQEKYASWKAFLDNAYWSVELR